MMTASEAKEIVDQPCEWYGRDMGKHDWVATVDGWKRCAKCKREYKPVELAPREKGSDESNSDISVVRHVDRPVLGSEEADLVPLPITDDRNQNPLYESILDILPDHAPSYAAMKFARAKASLESLTDPAKCGKCGKPTFYGSHSGKHMHVSASDEMDHEVMFAPAPKPVEPAQVESDLPCPHGFENDIVCPNCPKEVGSGEVLPPLPNWSMDQLRKAANDMQREAFQGFFLLAKQKREEELKASLQREKELGGFVVLCEEKLDQRLQGQYTNEQTLGMLLKEARTLMLKHSVKAAAVTGE